MTLRASISLLFRLFIDARESYEEKCEYAPYKGLYSRSDFGDRQRWC
jgi:hypothetical protein